MTAPLSRDLRERIARAVLEGCSIRQAAERFAVSPSAAIKLMQRVRQTGSTAPAKIGGQRRPILEPHADTLRASGIIAPFVLDGPMNGEAFRVYVEQVLAPEAGARTG